MNQEQKTQILERLRQKGYPIPEETEKNLTISFKEYTKSRLHAVRMNFFRRPSSVEEYFEKSLRDDKAFLNRLLKLRSN